MYFSFNKSLSGQPNHVKNSPATNKFALRSSRAKIDDSHPETVHTPIVFANFQVDKKENRLLKVLLDSGASSTIVHSKYTSALPTQKCPVTEWKTPNGTFRTGTKVIARFQLPELNETSTIEYPVHVTDHLGGYDMVLGRDLLHELGIKLSFDTKSVEWQNVSIPMKVPDCRVEQHMHIQDSRSIQDATNRIKQIIEAKYEPANLPNVVSECVHLQPTEKQLLLQLLQKYKSLFDGTLGHWKGETYDIQLKPDVQPYHARAYPIPKAYESTLRMEVSRLCQAGVLKKVNRSEWAAPTFIIPKKDMTVRFNSDFRELNKRIRRKPYPIPKIQDLMLKLEGFTFGTSLDLNMGYYHIELSDFSKTLCTIVLPWGKYEYQRLPMGLCNSPDIFQEKMGTLMQDLEYARAYIDDLLIITKGTWQDHLDKLEQVLVRLEEAGLKINAKKSFFGRGELEYLGYWITRRGIQPLPKKVDAMIAIQPPTNKKHLRSFIGMINYYRDMWRGRSGLLAPLTQLTSKTAKWEWTNTHQKAFEDIKKVISKETLLAYPNFNKPFVVHTDASKTQLGAVISQDKQPIAFYSRKLNPAQTRYTTTERELLAIVETLKEFRNILLGQHIKVYTDHKNLTYKNFNCERVMRWRLVLEEFGPELIYLPGEVNIVADALSRLSKEEDKSLLKDSLSKDETIHMAEYFGFSLDDLPKDAFPLTYKIIMEAQQQDKELINKVETRPAYSIKEYHGGGKKWALITYNGKISVPRVLQERLVHWYHDRLCHPGETRTELTIRQHFTWKNLRDTVHKVCSKCPICQKAKRSGKKYGHLPEKEAEAMPWDVLCVDLIGPYMIDQEVGPPVQLWCVTMIDPATSWLEIRSIETKSADVISNVIEQAWFTRYPWPSQVVMDRGSEFMAEFAQTIQEEYGIKKKRITTRNPQANSIIERIHQTIGQMLRTMDISHFSAEEAWDGILAAVMFAVRSTVHTTLQATPMQLVFGRDAILNTKFEADWNLIKQRKQARIRSNNKRENSRRIRHHYKKGDKVLFLERRTNKYGKDPWSGPHKIRQVNNNGTVVLKKGAVIDTVNIRLIKPYVE